MKYLIALISILLLSSCKSKWSAPYQHCLNYDIAMIMVSYDGQTMVPQWITTCSQYSKNWFIDHGTRVFRLEEVQ